MEQLVSALAKAQGAMKNAALNKVNPHFKSKYADLATIRDAVIPALAKEGIACTQTIERDDTGLVVKTTLLHGNDRLESVCPIMVAANAGAQQFGSALTYARRYSLAAIAGIAAEEDDDANEAQEAKPQQAQRRPANDRQEPKGEPTDWVTYGENWLEAAKQCKTQDDLRADWDKRTADLDKMKHEAPQVFARFRGEVGKIGNALAPQQAAE